MSATKISGKLAISGCTLFSIGTSIHDRKRAGRPALNSKIDLFMILYNARHTCAEQDIFPHLSKRNPAVIGYTALAWGQLIRPLKGTVMPSKDKKTPKYANNFNLLVEHCRRHPDKGEPK